MDKILLIDGHNAMWRASVTFAPQSTKPHELCLSCDKYSAWANDGHPDHCKCGGKWINGLGCDRDQPEEVVITFNFFRNLRPLIELFSPDKCFFVLEGHPQFRYDLFADYKANRIIKEAAKQKRQDTFFKAKDIIVGLMQHLPIAICRAASYEADDVISTLCENMKDEELTVISNDSDYIQLLQRGYSSIGIYNPIKKVFMEAPNYPYVAWKCLNGDKSDNIPACLKPKKALETVLSPELFKKFMEVEENRANFSVNRQLIEFRPVPEEEIILKEGYKNFPLLRNEFQKLKFESITNDQSWQKYTSTFNCIKY
jgi:5'-3' exonuclease